MKVIMTKANSDYWVRVKNFDSMEDLIKEQKKWGVSLILEKNYAYKEKPEDILEWWDDIDINMATEISASEYKIIIYNDYIE